uniref:Uncharacterized protein n=1 Tax=Physcomitrium patens TaxID=3218 RepID=A0A7I4CEH2_PHYPA
MRFYLCGGLDAPDWILANIVTLSSIPSAKVKVLVEYIIQRISEGVFDYENALKITTDASLGTNLSLCKFIPVYLLVNYPDLINLWIVKIWAALWRRAGVSDAKACIAALHFMVSNAAKFDVEDHTLTRELQQLGLPKGQ